MHRICVGALVARNERGVSILLGHRAATRQYFPNVWDLPGGHCTIANDGQRIEAKGQMSRNGQSWEPDLQTTYTRVT